MIREVHNISEDAMRELLYQLKHPSSESVARRRKMMDCLQESMTVKHENGQDVVEFPDLDLSFINKNDTYVKPRNLYSWQFSFSEDVSESQIVTGRRYDRVAVSAA